MNKKSFFTIPSEVIFSRKIFPYHLYVFNPVSKDYAPFLASNTPFISSKSSFLKYIIEKGAKVAVLLEQKKTFLRTHDMAEEEIPSLKTVVNESEVNHQKKQEDLKKIIEVDTTSFKESLHDCIQADNYLPLIKKAQQNIMVMSIKINPTVSMAIKLSEILMNQDTEYNRIVAVSYFLAIGCKITDHESIGDLVVAAFLHHIGYTQLDLSISNQPYFKLSDRQKKDFKNHAGLSHHLIRKSEVDFSKRCITLINQHHERYNGLGYPNQTMGTFIDPLALVLGASSHMVEFSSGRILEEKRTLESVIKMIKSMNTVVGLELSFGDLVYDSISHLLDDEEKSKDVGQNKAA